jgi:tRNA 2-selenouridine synthase
LNEEYLEESLLSAPVRFHENYLDTHLVVDVRTPLEYEEDHLPGAINVPLLDNEERVEIGTIYKQEGPYVARQRGLELTAHRFPAMVAVIKEAAIGRPILVYCWRGGLRSRTVTAILELTGHDALQLEGGYKTFRNHVIASFNPFRPPGPLVVLHGMTGLGKTTFLLGLQKKFSVIDLEGIACHRGSAFGALGLSQTLTQKRFETLLWDAFRRLPSGMPIIIEGESKRIGKISLPGELYEVMQQSFKVWCEASLETRVRRLMDEYGLPEYRADMEEALDRIKKRLGKEKYTEIAGHLDRWEMAPFMEELIRNYYDKVYYKTREWREDATLSMESYSEAENALTEILKNWRG